MHGRTEVYRVGFWSGKAKGDGMLYEGMLFVQGGCGVGGKLDSCAGCAELDDLLCLSVFCGRGDT